MMIMTNDIFQFGETFWRQLRDAAMGTSCAVNYVNAYVGIHEKNQYFLNTRITYCTTEGFLTM